MPPKSDLAGGVLVLDGNILLFLFRIAFSSLNKILTLVQDIAFKEELLIIALLPNNEGKLFRWSRSIVDQGGRVGIFRIE
ncbi:hypothetical protein TYRP_011769 [Tyrophagus putrescentiae]|nr:hypothetical protein TYRP_011769 [Tyrophagus putrescentiae]